MKVAAVKFAKEYRSFVLFVFLMVMFRSAIADWNDVPTGSMKPTIVEGDRILVNKLAYDLRIPLTHVSLYRIADPKRGEIVVFDSEAADRRLVKRVIGVPGDTVELIDNRLIVNDAAAVYSDVQYADGAIVAVERIDARSHRVRVDAETTGRASSFGPVTVPEEHYLMLGDNRDNSADSRYYGFVPRDEIIGRSRTVVLSLDPENYFLPRDGRFVDPL